MGEAEGTECGGLDFAIPRLPPLPRPFFLPLAGLSRPLKADPGSPVLPHLVASGSPPEERFADCGGVAILR